MPGRLCSTPIEGCTKLLKRDDAQIEIRRPPGSCKRRSLVINLATAGQKHRARMDQKLSCDAFTFTWWLRESQATVSYLLVRISLSMLLMRTHVR